MNEPHMKGHAAGAVAPSMSLLPEVLLKTGNLKPKTQKDHAAGAVAPSMSLLPEVLLKTGNKVWLAKRVRIFYPSQTLLGNLKLTQKGHAFTIDALLGVILFVLLLTSIIAYAGPSRETAWSIPQERQAQDALIVLDKHGTFDSFNSSAIDSALGAILGNGTRYHLDLITYNYTGGAFVSINNATLGQTLPNETTTYSSERSFIVSSNGSGPGSISNYTIARLYVWR